MEKSLVLVLSPYTDDHDEKITQQRVVQAEFYISQLLMDGIHAISVVAAFHHMTGKYGLPRGFKFWEDFCYLMIDKADFIHVLELPGWRESKGVAKEIDYCVSKGKEINFIPPQILG